MPGGSIQKVINRWNLCALGALLFASPLWAEGESANRATAGTADRTTAGGANSIPFAIRADLPQGTSSRALRQQAIAALPTSRLTKAAQQRILSIANSPTIYRRLPAQAIDCDRDMFLFLARSPEVMVGMWDLMGVTKVKTKRTGPYQLDADDGSGTKCNIDLIYGDPNTHIYVTEGSYEGMLTARPLTGKGVVILTSTYARGADDRTTVTGTIDLFMQVNSLGLDLVARTLSPMIGRSADYNFIETARFVGQISQASERNPPAMIDVAKRMPQIDNDTRQKFIGLISHVGAKSVIAGRIAERPDAPRR